MHINSLTDNQVIICYTQEDTEQLLTMLKDENKRWCSGKEYKVTDYIYDGMCFNVVKGQYMSKRFATEKEYEIIDFSDFLSKDNPDYFWGLPHSEGVWAFAGFGGAPSIDMYKLYTITKDIENKKVAWWAYVGKIPSVLSYNTGHKRITPKEILDREPKYIIMDAAIYTYVSMHVGNGIKLKIKDSENKDMEFEISSSEILRVVY